MEHFFYNLFPIHVSGPTGVLSVVFMEQESHNQLHGQFLNDFRPTDVITFPADEEENQAGEICVSVDMAKEQSSLRKISLAEELSLYLIHGWLHLIGFNDIEKIDRVRMKQEEKNCLAIVKKSRLIPDLNSRPPVPSNSEFLVTQKQIKNNSVAKKFRNAFLTGLLIFLPLGTTIFVLDFLLICSRSQPPVWQISWVWHPSSSLDSKPYLLWWVYCRHSSTTILGFLSNYV